MSSVGWPRPIRVTLAEELGVGCLLVCYMPLASWTRASRAGPDPGRVRSSYPAQRVAKCSEERRNDSEQALGAPHCAQQPSPWTQGNARDGQRRKKRTAKKEMDNLQSVECENTRAASLGREQLAESRPKLFQSNSAVRMELYFTCVRVLVFRNVRVPRELEIF